MSFTADIEFEVEGKERKFTLDPTKGRNPEELWPDLDGIKERVNDLRPVWGTVHQSLLNISEKTFSTKGSNIGARWPEYNADEAGYVRYKSKFVPNVRDSLMRWKPRRERLYPSLTSAKHKEHVWKTTPKSVEFGTSVPYAKLIDAGNAPGWKGKYTQPKRKLLGVSKGGFTRIMSIIQLYVIRGEVSRLRGIKKREGIV